MDFTATPETGPVDASASMDSVLAEFEAGTEAPADALESVVQELVNDPEGKGDAAQAPATEEDATDPAEEPGDPEEGTPEGTEEADAFAALLATNPDLTVKIKVNGETIEVPLSDLPNGYSRTEDYKAKTAAVAEQRRELEAKATSIETDVKAAYANQLEEATNLFARFDPVLAQANTIDWAALKQADPAAYVQAQDAVNERLTAIQQMNAEVARQRGEAQQYQAQAAEQERAQRFDTAATEIVKALPELADEAKFATFANDAVGFLRNEGFSQEEIADSLDHRVMLLANDARQWRAHKAAQQSLPEKKVVPRSAVKPLVTDGAGSRATPPRFPANASRDRKVAWAVQQFHSEG